MEIRKEIMDFALLMESVMRKHDRYKKDSWKDCKLDYLEKKLVKEYNEWKDGTTECPSKDEVIDIANVCMMLFHRYDMNKLCPFHPKQGVPYCRLQVRIVQLNTGEFEVIGYHTCVGEEKCPIVKI